MESSKFVETAKRIIREDPEAFEALVEFERTKKLPKLHYHKRINLTIRDDGLREFRRYCTERGINMSAAVERFMKETVKKL
jgi:hypothetical protein